MQSPVSVESEWIWSAEYGDYYKVITNPDGRSGHAYYWSKSGVPPYTIPHFSTSTTSYTTTASQSNASQYSISHPWYTETTSQSSDRNNSPDTSPTTTASYWSNPHREISSQAQFDIVDKRRRFIIVDHGRFEYLIPGYINGNIQVNAFPDTCSTFNIVSQSFLHANSIDYNSSERTMITLPNRTSISTIGNVDLSFQFTNGFDLPLTFAVLATCVHDVIIGTLFLQRCNLSEAHGSWKTVVKRQYKQADIHRPQVCLADAPQQAVTGYINDCETVAAPDTGSEVNLIRLDYAEDLGLEIDYSDTTELELIDGSAMETCGIVREAVWRFGTEGAGHGQAKPRVSSPPIKKKIEMREFGQRASLEEEYVCDFLVVRDFSVNLILSADLLYGLDAFTACSTLFSSSHGNEASGMLIRRRLGWVASIWNFFGGSRTRPPVNRAGTTLTEEQNEAKLRNRNEYRISHMPRGSEQDAAWGQERRRQRAYDATHPDY